MSARVVPVHVHAAHEFVLFGAPSHLAAGRQVHVLSVGSETTHHPETQEGREGGVSVKMKIGKCNRYLKNVAKM